MTLRKDQVDIFSGCIDWFNRLTVLRASKLGFLLPVVPGRHPGPWQGEGDDYLGTYDPSGSCCWGG